MFSRKYFPKRHFAARYFHGKPTSSYAFSSEPSADLLTLCDVVTSLIDRSMAPEDDARTIRLMTSAVQQAMRDIPKRGKWMHYTGILRFRASAQVSPTVDYTESTRTMVTTDGTVWPSDAERGEVLVGNTPYAIDTRVSDSTIVLSTNGTPNRDMTGESVQWQRQRYHFGKHFTKVHYLINLDNRLPLAFVDIATFYERQRLVRFAGIPSIYSMRNSDLTGWTDVVIAPASESAYLFEAQVSYQPTVPRIYKLTGSNGTISAGSKVFRSAGAKFTNDCYGAVLRIYESSDDIPFGRPVFESLINSPTSQTELLLENAAPLGYSGTAIYVISSHLDIDQTLMGSLLEDSAYTNYCQNHDHKGWEKANAIEKRSLIEALAANTKLNHSTSREFAWSLAMARPPEFAQLTGPVG